MNNLKSVSQLAVILVVQLAMFSCSQSSQTSQATNNIPPQLPVVELSESNTMQYDEYAVDIENRKNVNLMSRSNGYITQVCVAEGSTVKKGQIIMKVEQSEYLQRVNAAQATVTMCKAQLSNAMIEVEKMKPLVEENIISNFQLSTAQANVALAKAQLAQAESQLSDAQIQLSYTQLRSPMDGVIGRITIFPGSLITAGTVVTTIAENSDAIAYFSLDEKKVLELSANKPLSQAIDQMERVKLVMADGTIYPYKGKVEVASSIINSNTGSLILKATFKNPNLMLRSGATGKVLIPVAYNNIILVPQKATFELQDKVVTYVVGADSTVSAKVLETIGTIGTNYIVNGGVIAGDKIITEGMAKVREGMKISPTTK